MRQYSIGNGRDLTGAEKQIIDMIDNHSFQALNGYGKLGNLNISLVLEDSYFDNKPIKIDCDDTQRRLLNARNNYQQLVNESKYEDARTYEEEMAIFKGILNSAGQDSGTVTKAINIPWLGKYDHKHKTVTLYMDNIDSKCPPRFNRTTPTNWALFITYIHEMMHAYFDTQNAEEKVEEPIVEYCTLKFIDDFYKNNRTYQYMYSDAIGSIKQKKYSLGCTHYGFGFYLYEKTQIDWMKEYKNTNNTYSHTSEAFVCYTDSFGGLVPYPAGNEDYTEFLLDCVLHNKDISIKLSSHSVQKSSTTVAEGIRGTYAILYNGHVIAKSNRWANLVRDSTIFLINQDPYLISVLNSLYKTAFHRRRDFILDQIQYNNYLSNTHDKAAAHRYFNASPYYIYNNWGVDSIGVFFSMLKGLNMDIEIWKINIV